MVRAAVVLAGAFLVATILWDAFEAFVLPRRVTRRLRPTRLFYGTAWTVWSAAARRVRTPGRRETVLSYFGPLSLLLLIAMWAALLVFGFGLLQSGAGADLDVRSGAPGGFWMSAYLSGTTFFTLGLGDVAPASTAARVLTVMEAGTGFLFLAVVIAYLPVLYQAFSRREVNIALLDARAGSPPSATELLRRHGEDLDALTELLRDWERWSAEVLESHLSYPVLSYFRSQHDNQSWLASLTTMLDTTALVIVGVEGACARQAALTFAIARHAVVDLTQVLRTPPRAPATDRLPPATLAEIRRALAAHGVALRDAADAAAALAALRALYEPYVAALSARLLMPLPAWISAEPQEDWRTTAWERPPDGPGAWPGARAD